MDKSGCSAFEKNPYGKKPCSFALPSLVLAWSPPLAEHTEQCNKTTTFFGSGEQLHVSSRMSYMQALQLLADTDVSDDAGTDAR